MESTAKVPDPPVSTIDGHRVLTYVHTNGVHQLPTSFCKCSGAPLEELQLLRMGFLPLTSVTLQTSFTFQLLDNYLLENLECKTSALHYFSKLRRMTSKAFPNLVKVCNEAFSILLLNGIPHRTGIVSYCEQAGSGESLKNTNGSALDTKPILQRRESWRYFVLLVRNQE